MKDTNIVRVKAYIGGCINRPYVCNELPVSGVPSEYFSDKSVRSLVTDDQFNTLVKLLCHYSYATSTICPNRIETPSFYHRACPWDHSGDHCYMVFDIEVETRVTVHETAEDNESDYIKVTRKDMVRLLKQLKEEENKHIEAIEKQFSDYFGI